MQRYRVNYTLLIGLLVGSVVAAGSIYGIWSWQMTGNANSLLERADEAEANGEYVEAAGLLNNYLAFRPGDDEVRLRQAHMFVDIGNQALEDQEFRDFMMAKDNVVNALFKYPEDDELRSDLVELLMHPTIMPFFAEGFAKDVLGHVKSLLAKNPDDPELMYKQAMCLTAIKKPDEAVAVLSKLVGYDDLKEEFDVEVAIAPNDTRAYALLARTLFAKLDRPEQARAVEDQLVEVNPELAKAYLERGRFLSRIDEGEGSRNDYGKQASEDLQKAYELDSKDGEILLAMAGEAEKQEDYDQTRRYLEEGLEIGTDMAVFYSALARMERRQTDANAALQQIERGLAAVQEKQRPYLLLDKIDFQIDAGNLTGAEETIKQFEREVPIKRPEIEFYQARIMAARDQWVQAAKMLEEVRPKLSANPRMRPQVDMLLGMAHRKNGHNEKALAVYRQLLREYPSNKFADAQYKALLRMMGTDGGSVPDETTFEGRLAQELNKSEEEQDWQTFNEFAEQWFDENEVPEVRRKLFAAQVLVSRKKYDEARKPLVEAYKMADDDVSVRRAAIRLVALDPNEGPERALKMLDAAVDDEKVGDQWQLRLDRADFYMALNRESVVEDLLSVTEDIDKYERGQQIEIWKHVATRLARAGKREESEAAWSKVAEIDPNSLPTLMQMFEMALMRNDDDAMREAQKKVLKLVGTKNDANWAFTEAARKYVQYRREPDNDKLREEIMKLVDTALDGRPDWNAPYILRAGLEMMERDYLSALRDYKEGFSRGRGNATALAQYVRLLKAQGNVTEALAQLEQYDPATNVVLIGRDYPQLLLQAGQFRDAVDAADRINAAGEDSGQTQLWYGQFVQAVSGLPGVPEDLKEQCQQSAGEALSRAVELAGDTPAPWLSYVTYLLATGQPVAAEDALREAQVQLEEDQQQLLKARGYEMMGRWFDAENIYQTTYDQNPESEQVARQLATFYLSRRYPRPDGPAKAAKLINEILRRYAADPNSVSRANANWARRTSAKLLASTGDYQNLIKAEKLLASNAENGTLAVEDKLQMAQILAVRPEPVSRTKAIRLLEEVNAQQKLTPELDLALGKLYFAVGNWPKCRDHMESVVTRYPDSFPVRDAYIRMLLNRGRSSNLRAAEGHMRKLIDIAPRSPATYELVSLVYDKLGDEKRSKQALQRMLPDDLRKLDDNGYRLVARVAMLLANSGDLDTSERLLTVVAQRPEATFADQMQFTRFIGTYRDPDRAFEILGKAIDDANALAVIDAGTAIARAKRDEVGDKYDATIEGWIDRAARDDPGSIPVLIARASLRDVQGQYEEAASIYRQVLAEDRLQGANKAAMLNNLAYLLALGAADEQSPNESVSLIREAVDILGPISDILDTRAVIWIGRGEYQAAVDDMELAVTDKPTASKYFHKALAHMGLKQNSDALAAWERAEGLGLARDSVGRLEEQRYDKLKEQIDALRAKGQGL